MKRLFFITVLIIMILSTTSVFAATVPETLPHCATGDGNEWSTVTEYNWIDPNSCLAVGDVAILIPIGWDASVTFASDGTEYGKLVSPNGYEIHLNVSTGAAFSTEYANVSLRSQHSPINTVEAGPMLYNILSMDNLAYFVRTNENTMYFLQYIDKGDWLPGHGSTIKSDEYFYPTFMTPSGYRAELYGFQGNYKVANQCMIDAMQAATIIKSIMIVNYD